MTRHAAASSRYPLRPELDGDFTPEQIVAALDPPRPPHPPRLRPAVAAAARAARLWDLQRPTLGNTNTSTPPQAATSIAERRAGRTAAETSTLDSNVLHAFETSRLWRPPVHSATAALTPRIARSWLDLTEHWLASACAGDLRYLNAACKLLGAVWVQYTQAVSPPAPEQGEDGAHEWRKLAGPLGQVASWTAAATDQLAALLARRLLAPHPEPAPTPTATRTAGGPDAANRRNPAPRIVVLAAATSAGAGGFLELAAEVGLSLQAICWYAGSPVGASDPTSGYAGAWYPPPNRQPTNRQHRDFQTPARPQHEASTVPAPRPAESTVDDWAGVAGLLTRQRADLVVLLGMPIIPAPLLDLARIGFINAHNGALPQYRGMDAVAWALLNDEAVVCTLHLARPKVDAGEVLATEPVPVTPTNTLHARVKAAQLRLLLGAARTVTATGRLPDATPQPPAEARQFYPLHPHLKRVLDASPYAAQTLSHLLGSRPPTR